MNFDQNGYQVQAKWSRAQVVSKGDHSTIVDLSSRFDKDVVAYVLEDTRLSTLQRKLLKESSPSKQLALACQITESIKSYENRSYVRRSFQILCDSIAEVFTARFGEPVKRESAEALACVGFIISQPSKSEPRDSNDGFFLFHNWLWGNYLQNSKPSVKVCFLQALASFIGMKSPYLLDSEITKILGDIRDQLETTEDSEIMIAIVDAFVITSQWKPKIFESHFQNVVDILVGWHIDSSHNPNVRMYVSKVLLSWHSFWILDMQFSSDLLRSFMEDLEAFTNDVLDAKTPDEMKEISERILSLIQVFNAVLSCLRSSMSPDRLKVVSFLPPESPAWCRVIFKCLLTTLEKRFDEDFVVAGQDAFLMLQERIESLPVTHKTELMSLAELIFQNFELMSSEGQVNSLRFIGKLCTSISHNQIVREIVSMVLNSKSKISLVQRCCCSRSSYVRDEAASLFRSLLNSKDIVVLQEVYGHLTHQYQASLFDYGHLNVINSQKKYSEKGSFEVTTFVLECMSHLIDGRGSVLSVWALDPLIFNLFVKHSPVLDQKFIRNQPWIHFAIIRSLHVHSSANSHFIPTTSLWQSASGQSPTSENLRALLELLTNLLDSKFVTPSTRQLLLEWTRSLLEDLHKSLYPAQMKFHSILIKPPVFNLVASVIKMTHKQNYLDVKKEGLELVKQILTLMSEDPCDETTLAVWKGAYRLVLRELDSSNKEVRELSMKIFSLIPTLVANFKETNLKIIIAEDSSIDAKMAFLRHQPVNLRMVDFKVLADALLKTPDQSYAALMAVFDSYVSDPSFSSLAHSYNSEMNLWQNFQLAQSCVHNKLKTALGKPQDTLTSFEKVLRHLATVAAERKPLPVADCRKLLQFFDLLEKSFVNAGEGSTINWTAPSKTVVTFFKANKKTCTDWLTRLRPFILTLAFHVGEYAFFLRNADKVLIHMAEKVQATPFSEQDEAQVVPILAMLAVSLRKLQSTEALTGLYVWCKEKLRKRFPWIRAIAELSRGRLEDGIQYFTTAMKSLAEGGGTDETTLGVLNRELFNAIADLGMENDDYVQLLQKHKESFKPTPNYSDEYLTTLSRFDNGRIVIPSNFVSSTLTTDVEESLIRTNRILLQCGSSLQNHTFSVGSTLSEAHKQLNHLLVENKLTEDQLQRVRILKAVQEELNSLSQLKRGYFEHFSTFEKGKHNCATLLLVKKWVEFFANIKNDANLIFKLNNLNVELAIAARKEKNMALAQNFLRKSLCTNDLHKFVSNFSFPTSFLTVDQAACLRQFAKLLRLQGDTELAVKTLCGISTNINGAIIYQPVNISQLMEVSSRCLNNLALWFRCDTGLLDRAVSSDDVDCVLALQGETDKSFLARHGLSPPECTVFSLLHRATVQTPTLAKMWNSFASLCLELGEKTLSNCEDNLIMLTPDEELRLVEIFSGSVVPKVARTMLQQVHLKPSCRGAVETEKIALMKRELMDCQDLAEYPDVVVEHLHNLWQDIQYRIFFFHETAVNAYFKFIDLGDDSSEDKSISATLRLLQLTVKHALELQESIQTGLAQTPCGRWRAIIPQLFSRLNHPVRTVRNRIGELLCRIADEHSQLVIYPAVVGSMSSASSDTLSKLFSSKMVEDETSAECALEDDKNPEMQSAHAKIVDAIAKKSPEASLSVDQIRFMVLGLQRISLLWDELWMSTIQQYGAEVNRRVKKMDDEVKRLNNNSNLTAEEKKSLSKEKYNIIFKPLLYVFEKVYAITSNPPETPNEKSFAKNYGEFLNTTLKKLRDPPDPTKPLEVWSLLSYFSNQKLKKRSGLKLQEISTALYNMKETLVPMPGLAEDSKKELYVSSFENILSVLPSKTKPKRIILIGSDGKKYAYLFKGLEDLHLDERIMQFLIIANKLMKKTGGEYKARHYSVVPLGVRSGLIQWVQGAIPMFGFYKRWSHLHQTDQNKNGKACDMFYNKLIPLLREHGITNLDNRKEWPLTIMRQVLKELMAETPSNLLSQEFWFSSIDASHWFKLTQAITRSVAVMSIIGYIIGLGDRHLDNLLVDLNSGEIIHIDYNVCFEKGRNLRIPENVPCRLTQNIVNCFGFSGVEGVFRLSCEHTLETMRTGRETFLALLEAFVYDPLVDWTPGIELGLAGTYYQGDARMKNLEAVQDKRDLHTEMTFSMLAVRLAEIRKDWFENRAQLGNLLVDAGDELMSFLDWKTKINNLEESLAKSQSGIDMLSNAKTQTDHRLFALQDHYFEHTLAEEAMRKTQSQIASFIEQNERSIHLHQRAMALLSSNQLGTWGNEIADIHSKVTRVQPINEVIGNFLDQAGQASVREDFASLETQYFISISQMKQEFMATLQALNNYGTVALLYPQSYKQEHRSVLYQKWMTDISEEFTLQKCEDVMNEFTIRNGELNSPNPQKLHQFLQANHQLDSFNQAISSEIQQVCDTMKTLDVNNMVSVTLEAASARSALQTIIQTESPSVAEYLRSVATHMASEKVESLLNLEAAICGLTNSECQNVESWTPANFKLVEEVMGQIDFFSKFFGSLDILGQKSFQEWPEMSCFLRLQNVMNQLQDLHSKFFSIILQEGLKSFQAEDQSTLSMATDLENFINDAGVSLEELVQDIDSQILCLQSTNEIQDDASVTVAKLLENKFNAFISAINAKAKMSPGEMLVLGINKLYSAASNAFIDYRNSLQETNIMTQETVFDKMTVVSGSISLVRVHLNPELYDLVDLAMSLHRMNVIHKYFKLCGQTRNAFKFENGAKFPSYQELSKLVCDFIVEFYCRNLVGLPSFTCSLIIAKLGTFTKPLDSVPFENLHDFLKLLVEEKLSNDVLNLNPMHLAMRVEAWILSLRRLSQSLSFERHLETVFICQRVNFLQQCSLQWFYDEEASTLEFSRTISSKTSAITDLSECLDRISKNMEKLSAFHTKFMEFNSTIEQRMKWACGANPDLQELLDTYSGMFSKKLETLKSSQSSFKSLVGCVNAILLHEALRTSTVESMNSDSAFASLLSDCQQSTLMLEKASRQPLSENDRRMFEINPPNFEAGVIDSKWVTTTLELLKNDHAKRQEDINENKNGLQESCNEIKSYGEAVRRGVVEMQELMVDVGAILRTIEKSDDFEIPEITRYLQRYRKFSDLASAIAKDMIADEMDADKANSILNKIGSAEEIVNSIYDDLIEFATILKEDTLFKSKKGGRGVGDEEDAIVNGTSKEEKNAFALTVLKRIKTKLEGRDPDSQRKSSVAEQVDFVIREATDLDNLSLLYEGWTAWI